MSINQIILCSLFALPIMGLTPRNWLREDHHGNNFPHYCQQLTAQGKFNQALSEEIILMIKNNCMPIIFVHPDARGCVALYNIIDCRNVLTVQDIDTCEQFKHALFEMAQQEFEQRRKDLGIEI